MGLELRLIVFPDNDCRKQPFSHYNCEIISFQTVKPSMKNVSQIVKYAIVALVFLLLGLWVYIESHQPQLKGKLALEGNTNDVDVYFDDYGIPHIYAQNSKDAYRTLGYVHAQDRLFQMELMRRVGAGRLAEIFGPELVEADMLFRTLGTHTKAKTDAAKFESLPENLQTSVRAYIEGVNTYIQKGKLPLEYKILGIEEELFTVEDMYCIAGYMAYSFAYSIRTDPIVEFMHSSLDKAYLVDLDLGYALDSLSMHDSISDFFPVDSTVATAAYLSAPKILDNLPSPLLQGSNGWAVGGHHSLSGKVILANDPHIKYASPAVWYEAHIEYPGFGFYGGFMAGIPVGLVGHSRYHAWGVTMFEDDDSDFYFETFANADSSKTHYRDSLFADVVKTKEVIHISGEPDTVITVYNTVHGPIVNDFLPVSSDKPVSMYWNYTNNENKLFEAFYRMNHTSDMEGFKSGVRMIGSPGLNINYGDASGNIAMWSAGKLIDRPDSSNGKEYLEGAESRWENNGFYDFDNNPKVENPDVGYILSANQKHDTIEGIDYPGYYAPHTRYDRIEKLLNAMSPLTVDSVKQLILDNVSETELGVAHEIAEVIMNGAFVPREDEQAGLEILLGWDGGHDIDDIGPTLYYKVLYYSLKGAMLDEMGKDVFEAFLTTFAMKRSYPKFFRNDKSIWWDNIKTEGMVESREIILSKAFQRSIAEIESELGMDMTQWQWGNVHTLKHGHPLGKVELLSTWFDVGPFPAPGGHETINNAGFSFNGKGHYEIIAGPSMRTIIDFADVEHALTILPTGNSGNIMSPHFQDQAEMYVNGEFRMMMMNKEEIQEIGSLLKVTPKE